MSNQNQTGGMDFGTSLFDFIVELVMTVFKLLGLILKMIWKKAFAQGGEMKKVERDQLRVKKQTSCSAYFGVDTANKRPVENTTIDFKMHNFIVGASGFGKTNLITLLQEMALKSDKALIFFDPKGDLGALNSFKKLSEKWGRTCYIFSEYYEDSIALNPLKSGTISQICDRLMSSFEWSEPFYEDCCTEALLKVLKEIKGREQVITIQRILEKLKGLHDDNIKGLITKLELIHESHFGNILSDDEAFTLQEIRDKKVCLYIGLSTQGYPRTAPAIGKILFYELMNSSYGAMKINADEAALKNPISVFFDEFGALIRPDFIELQNKCRGAGIELTVAVQTPADIDRIDPFLTKQVIENVGNTFILKQRVQEYASFLSESIGTTITKKQTYKIEEGEETEMGSEREVHEMLVHPDIIKSLQVGQCIWLQQQPLGVRLMNLRNSKTTLNDNFVYIRRQENKEDIEDGICKRSGSSIPDAAKEMEATGLENTEGGGRLPRIGSEL